MAASSYPTSSAAHAGAERLWKIWWVWGILVGWTTSGMIFFAEFIRAAGYWGGGDLVVVIRLLVYLSWARLACRCSHNVKNRQWTSVSRFALGTGFVSMAMF
jgi:hypothetical protein